MRWFRALFSKPRPAAASPEPAETSSDVSFAGELLRYGHRDAAGEQLAELQRRLQAWYALHPLEVKWGRDYSTRIHEPLVLDPEDLLGADDGRELVSWARLLRSFALGRTAREVTRLLRADDAPAHIENLDLRRHLDFERAADVDELVQVLCTHDRMRTLRHLALPGSLRLTARHLERLATAAWAPTLETLDLTEVMIDWDADPRRAVLRALAAFGSLTHLVLYNDVGAGADLDALFEAPWASLTHLNLGSIGKSASVLEGIARIETAPRLTELCLSGGPARTDPAWDSLRDARIPVYCSGCRVDATYPNPAP